MKWNDSDIYIYIYIYISIINLIQQKKKRVQVVKREEKSTDACVLRTVAGVAWWAIFNGFAGEARWRSLQKWSGLNTDRQQVLKVNATN